MYIKETSSDFMKQRLRNNLLAQLHQKASQVNEKNYLSFPDAPIFPITRQLKHVSW